MSQSGLEIKQYLGPKIWHEVWTLLSGQKTPWCQWAESAPWSLLDRSPPRIWRPSPRVHIQHQGVFWPNHGRLINGPFCRVYLLSMPHVVITCSFLCLPLQFGRVLRTCHSQILRTWAFCRTSRRRANSWTQRSGWRKGSASCGELKTETNSTFQRFFTLFLIQSLLKIRS